MVTLKVEEAAMRLSIHSARLMPSNCYPVCARTALPQCTLDTTNGARMNQKAIKKRGIPMPRCGATGSQAGALIKTNAP
jgi:hypothetical protein